MGDGTNISCAPIGQVLCKILTVLSHLILMTTLQGRYPILHFRDEESEAV